MSSLRSQIRSLVCLAAGLAALAATAPAGATQVKIFRTQSQSAFLAGTLSGVSVDALGSVELAPRTARLTAIGEPFLFAAADLPDGWVVGTGSSGKVLAIDRQGKVSELFAAPEPEVFAVWADRDGTVFAGTSPRGKVYRIPRARDGGAKGSEYGKAEVYFDPGETYIWALARGADGALLVATGTQGKLFRVEGKGQGRVLYDSEDTHLRSLLPLPGGDVVVGTAGEGLILRVGKDGQARTVYDAVEPEVVALAAGPDGSLYAAVVAADSSLSDFTKPAAASPSPAPPGAAGGGPGAGAGGRRGRSAEPQPTVSVSVEGDPGAAVVAPAKGTAKSELLHISPSGVVERLWSFADDTIYSLLWQDGALWVGTGLEGKLYRWANDQMLLEKDVDERQIVALLPGSPGPTFATTNAAALYRVTADREAHGTYTSATLDAGQVASFGSFRWRGEAPAGSAVRLSFRTGMSGEPDRTWSPWTPAADASRTAEVSLAHLPRGRYIQWRAELAASSGPSPRFYATELSYRQENLKPRIDSFTALEPGQIMVPATFNPGTQAYEPAHPAKDGIFNTLETAADDTGRSKTLWKKGYRTLRWTASDPNDDKLVYALSFRPAGSPTTADPAADAGWLKMVDDVEEDHYSFDATVLPDGVYRFRLVAADRKANDPGSGLAAVQVSEPVVIDQTPPALTGVVEKGGKLQVSVHDALSPIREAVYSVDAGEWKPAVPADGLLDAQTETLLLPPPARAGAMVLLRVTDAAYNVATYDLSHRH